MEKMGKIAVVVVGDRCKLARRFHGVDVCIDVMHQRKAKLLCLRVGGDGGERSGFFEVLYQKNVKLEKLGGEHLVSVRNVFGQVKLCQCFAHLRSDHAAVQDAILGARKILHDVFQILKEWSVISLEGEKVIVKGTGSIGRDLVKFGGEGKVNIPLAKLYGNVVSADDCTSVCKYCQFKPIAMQMAVDRRGVAAMHRADLYQLKVAELQGRIDMAVMNVIGCAQACLPPSRFFTL